MVPISLNGGVERFAGGNGPNLDEAVFFEAVEGAIDGGQTHGAIVVAELNVQILRRNGPIDLLQGINNLGLAPGTTCCH